MSTILKLKQFPTKNKAGNITFQTNGICIISNKYCEKFNLTNESSMFFFQNEKKLDEWFVSFDIVGGFGLTKYSLSLKFTSHPLYKKICSSLSLEQNKRIGFELDDKAIFQDKIRYYKLILN